MCVSEALGFTVLLFHSVSTLDSQANVRRFVVALLLVELIPHVLIQLWVLHSSPWNLDFQFLRKPAGRLG